jgi:hypothetical protein
MFQSDAIGLTSITLKTNEDIEEHKKFQVLDHILTLNAMEGEDDKYLMGTLRMCIDSVLAQYEHLPILVANTWNHAFCTDNLNWTIFIFLMVLPGHQVLRDICCRSGRRPTDLRKTDQFLLYLEKLIIVFLDGLTYDAKKCARIEDVYVPTITMFVDLCRDFWVTY